MAFIILERYIVLQVQLQNFKKFGKINLKIKQNEINLLTGVNNSGKTSILHALAVWEYAKILLIDGKGKESLTKEYDEEKKGFGIQPNSFSPINIPSLKYLWKDQKTNGSYDLKIKVSWKEHKDSHHLELAYTLNGNNFAIKKTSSSLDCDTKIPTIAYLPPFGGISENEGFLSVADRRKLIGKGQAGAVIRNLLLDLHQQHESKIQNERDTTFPNRERLNQRQKQILANVDTEWRALKKILGEVFRVNLTVQPFNSSFHNYINVDVVDIDFNDQNETIKKNTTKRDIMVEGSGFLQWLSVFTIVLDKENDIILLDEPDAHLHPSLQSLLIKELSTICAKYKKQVLMVTHSSELIKLIDYEKILYINNDKAEYLKNKQSKVVVLEGLGSKYFPLLDDIINKKRILMIENDSDTRTLQYLCESMGKTWPENLVNWVTTKHHSDRKTLISELNQKIMSETKQPILAYSLKDLDDESYSNTSETLKPKNVNDKFDDSGKHVIFLYRTLRRREIENYLIIPSALSRYLTNNNNNPEIKTDIEAINNYLSSRFGLIVNANHKKSDMTQPLQPLFISDLKSVLSSINTTFKISFSKEEYIKQIEPDQICEDIKTIINELLTMCEK